MNYKIGELRGFDAMTATAQYLSMITNGYYSLKLMSLINDDMMEGGKLENADIDERLANAIGKFRELDDGDNKKFLIFCELLGLSSKENGDYRYLYLNVCSDLQNVPISDANEDNFTGAELVKMAYCVFCKICDETHKIFF